MNDNPSNYQQQLEDSRAFWNNEADSFDNEPDHGLRDNVVRDAWATLLKQLLPPVPAEVLDMGCGTGSLSVLLASLGYTMTGVDVAPQMIAVAKSKAQAAGFSITFQIMDAAFPQFAAQQFDAIVCRHLLWTLPDPAAVLRRWCGLLKRGGHLHLIEGYWHTGSGLHASEVVAMIPDSMSETMSQPLSSHVHLWGSTVTDERYVISAKRAQ